MWPCPLGAEVLREVESFRLIFTGIRRISFVSRLMHHAGWACPATIIPFPLTRPQSFSWLESKGNLPSAVAFSV